MDCVYHWRDLRIFGRYFNCRAARFGGLEEVLMAQFALCVAFWVFLLIGLLSPIVENPRYDGAYFATKYVVSENGSYPVTLRRDRWEAKPYGR